jgi:hypothetical protein
MLVEVAALIDEAAERHPPEFPLNWEVHAAGQRSRPAADQFT